MSREVICGIYKIELKDEFKEQSSCNGIYIGQSVNIYRRWNYYSSTYNKDFQVINKAIHKYGIGSFNFNIIDKCDKSDLNDREIYWIDYYNSFKNGYNTTIGGDSGGRGEDSMCAYLSQEEADEIRKYYKDNFVNQSDVAEIFGTTKTVVNYVLTGKRYLKTDFAKNYVKPEGHRVTIKSEEHHGACLSQEEADELRKYYINNDIKQKDLAEKFGTTVSVVQGILYGKTYLDSEFAKNTSLKLKNQQLVLTQEDADNVRRKYNKNIKVTKMAKEYDVSITTIYRIIKKETYMDSKFSKEYKRREKVFSGNNNSNAKLNFKKVAKARILMQNGYKTKDVANLFNINKSYLGSINTNRNWKDDDYQKYLDNKITIQEFAEIKGINIKELKEWFNSEYLG